MKWHLTDRIETSAGTIAAGHGGEGPPLILAHGWPWSSFSWHRIIPKLAETHHVYWYDMPGYGMSDKSTTQRTSLDVQGVIFGEILDHWKLNRPKVIAHDFGGATTLRAHLLHGYEFEKYLLMNVVAMRPWGSEFFDHVGKHVDAFAGLPNHIHQAVVEAYIKGAIISDLDQKDFDALILPWLSDEGRNSFYAQFAQADECYTAEVEPMFGDIRCPVHVLWGEDDPWIPVKRGRDLHALITHSTFELLPNVGHLPQLESPELVLEKILPILAS